MTWWLFIKRLSANAKIPIPYCYRWNQKLKKEGFSGNELLSDITW